MTIGVSLRFLAAITAVCLVIAGAGLAATKTDVSNLLNLANAITTQNNSANMQRIKSYAQAQAAATQSQEAAIKDLEARVSALETTPPPPPPPADTAPTAPGNIRVSSITQSKIVIAWDASTDDVGVTDYQVSKGDVVLGTTDNTLDWADLNLSCGTSYTYSVKAMDAAGNMSPSATITAATAPCDTMPPPPSSGYPDASNTGVPSGITLTAYTGPSTVTVANTVIDAKSIGCITISAPGVVIKNSKITCNAFIVMRGGGSSSAPLVVQDSEIDCQGSNGTGVDVTNATFLRDDVSRCENGFNVGGPITVQDSYIHDLVTANGAHTDGAQFNQGASNIVFRHNTINPTPNSGGATSCIIMWDEGNPQNSNVLIENNRMLGAGTAATIYTPRQGPLTNVKVINNRMIPGSTYGLYNGSDGSLLTDGSGNVNDATGQPISLN